MQNKVITNRSSFPKAHKIKKGVSLADCIKKAKLFIKDSGSCLLLFDVCNSKLYPDRQKLMNRLNEMMGAFNKEYEAYFPVNNLAVSIRAEKGFEFILGDGAWAGINSEKVIPLIWKFQETYFPDILVRWDIARDGFDSENVKLVR